MLTKKPLQHFCSILCFVLSCPKYSEDFKFPVPKSKVHLFSSIDDHPGQTLVNYVIQTVLLKLEPNLSGGLGFASFVWLVHFQFSKTFNSLRKQLFNIGFSVAGPNCRDKWWYNHKTDSLGFKEKLLYLTFTVPVLCLFVSFAFIIKMLLFSMMLWINC